MIVFLRFNPQEDGSYPARITGSSIRLTRRFKTVTNPFVQIIHTGRHHWVCISSVGSSNGNVHLYDSLYHNVIQVKKQAFNLVVADTFSGLHIVPIQPQNNG